MNSKKWLKFWILIIIVIGVVPYGLVYIFLKSNYENNSFEEIVKRQLKNNSIYGTALNQNSFSYKLELIKQVKPKIISLGSSRVMQFRKESFNTSFVNAGGGMNYLNEGYKFLNEMYKFHKPEYIIIGLDFWWFNNNYMQPKYFPYHNNDGENMDYKKILKTLNWLFAGKIGFNKNAILNNSEKITNNYTNYDNLGFDAIATSDGFRSDGSRSYIKTTLGIKSTSDEKFLDTFKRIKNGNARFQYGNNISKKRLLIFENILKLIKKNNSKIILFIPPIANSVFNKMNNDNYKFIEKLRKYLSSLNNEIYDYHNLSILTNNDCECIDGFHGGDIIYQRILQDMYSNNSKLSKHLNINIIKDNIIKFKGRTLSILPTDKFKNNEIDFLKLGCIKNNKILDIISK